jgi:hypothetical protein
LGTSSTRSRPKLIFVDGVRSVACVEIDFDAWGLDGVVTASQKAIGCPTAVGPSSSSIVDREAVPSNVAVASSIGREGVWVICVACVEKPSCWSESTPRSRRCSNLLYTKRLALDTLIHKEHAWYLVLSPKDKQTDKPPARTVQCYMSVINFPPSRVWRMHYSCYLSRH